MTVEYVVKPEMYYLAQLVMFLAFIYIVGWMGYIAFGRRWKVVSDKEVTLELYELHKINKQLEKRGLSVKQLYEEYEKMFEKVKKRTDIEDIDEQYKEEKN